MKKIRMHLRKFACLLLSSVMAAGILAGSAVPAAAQTGSENERLQGASSISIADFTGKFVGKNYFDICSMFGKGTKTTWSFIYKNISLASYPGSLEISFDSSSDSISYIKWTCSKSDQGLKIFDALCSMAKKNATYEKTTGNNHYFNSSYIKNGQEFNVNTLRAECVTSIIASYTAPSANSKITVNRISGTNRYDTAAKIARAAFPNGASEAVLVSGANFPDALSASGLAGKLNCPILLTAPAALSSQTEKLLKDWKTGKITILGGYGSVSQTVENTLTSDCGIPAGSITRLNGTSRYDTAVKAMDAGSFDTSGACIIASGAKPADALSISPWSYKNGWPILLADGKGNLSDAALAAAQKFSTVYILGSENSVNASVKSALPNAIRIEGKNRYATSVNIAKQFASGYAGAVFVSGQDARFPDPLVGGMLAAKTNVPIILADGTYGAEFDFLASAFTGVTKITVIGGTASLPISTANALTRKIK